MFYLENAVIGKNFQEYADNTNMMKIFVKYQFSQISIWFDWLAAESEEAWIISVIFVGNKDLSSTADLMQLLCACHATAMSILQMHFHSATRALFCVTDAVHNQLLLGALKKVFHFVKIVIGIVMMDQGKLQGTKDCQ